MDRESIVERLRRRLREAGTNRFEAIAAATGVRLSFIRKFFYGDRSNPTIGRLQPLVDFFDDVDAGRRALPPTKPALEEDLQLPRGQRADARQDVDRVPEHGVEAGPAAAERRRGPYNPERIVDEHGERIARDLGVRLHRKERGA